MCSFHADQAHKLRLQEPHEQIRHRGREQEQVRQQRRYQPFYCEENIWWLCVEPPLGVHIELVIFVASLSGICPIAEQQAGAADGVAWWDYHCIALDQKRRIWDLDTKLPQPVAARIWIAHSFPQAAAWPAPLRPLFRLVPSADYLRDFSSDRRHMRDAAGHWLQPPPPWPCIGVGDSADAKASTRTDTKGDLRYYRDLSASDGPGIVIDLDAFLAIYCADEGAVHGPRIT